MADYDDNIAFPTPPAFTDEEWERCRVQNDYIPIVFEWYKHVGTLNVLTANMLRESPAMRPIAKREYYILVGLLQRCSRLILSVVAMSHEGRFGEATGIIDRCIMESAATVIWLCGTDGEDRFDRYVANGLRSDLELKSQILNAIQKRDGSVLEIESRMLASIDRTLSAAEMTEADVLAAKKLPDLASMMQAVGYDRLMYVVAQKIGSHAVHGTWTSLLTHYLRRSDDGEFRTNSEDIPAHFNNYSLVALVVLSALKSYATYVLEAEDVTAYVALLDEASDGIRELNKTVAGADFEIKTE